MTAFSLCDGNLQLLSLNPATVLVILLVMSWLLKPHLLDRVDFTVPFFVRVIVMCLQLVLVTSPPPIGGHRLLKDGGKRWSVWLTKERFAINPGG